MARQQTTRRNQTKQSPNPKESIRDAVTSELAAGMSKTLQDIKQVLWENLTEAFQRVQRRLDTNMH